MSEPLTETSAAVEWVTEHDGSKWISAEGHERLVAEAVKAARVQALVEAQGIVGCSGTRAFECYDDIQALIDAEKEAGK